MCSVWFRENFLLLLDIKREVITELQGGNDSYYYLLPHGGFQYTLLEYHP